MFGTNGVLETEYGGQVLLRGKHFYNGGKTPTSTSAARSVTLRRSTTPSRGDYANATVGDSVRSNLVTILGRTAAYEGRVVTWDELMNSEARLVADLNGLKD